MRFNMYSKHSTVAVAGSCFSSGTPVTVAREKR